MRLDPSRVRPRDPLRSRSRQPHKRSRGRPPADLCVWPVLRPGLSVARARTRARAAMTCSQGAWTRLHRPTGFLSCSEGVVAGSPTKLDKEDIANLGQVWNYRHVRPAGRPSRDCDPRPRAALLLWTQALSAGCMTGWNRRGGSAGRAPVVRPHYSAPPPCARRTPPRLEGLAPDRKL
jgi:hypothetical protein